MCSREVKQRRERGTLCSARLRFLGCDQLATARPSCLPSGKLRYEGKQTRGEGGTRGKGRGERG